MLSRDDDAFLQRRARLHRWWPWAAAALLLAVLGLWGYFFASGSLLVNPWAILTRLEAGDLPPATLAALAVLGAVGFLTLGFVMVAMVGLFWAALRNERRLLEIVRKLRG